VSIISNNRVEWAVASFATVGLGARFVPMYESQLPKDWEFILKDCEANLLIVPTEEIYEKVRDYTDKIPSLTRIIRIAAPKSVEDSFEALVEKGKATPLPPTKPDKDDIAFLIYTSGTTGNPKGVMLSHRNMIATAESFLEVNNVKRSDNWLSYLPMAWVGDAAFTLGMALVARLTANCPENPETVQRDLRELGPDVILAPPRIWENMLTIMQVKAGDASPLKRRVFEHFRALAERCELKKTDGKPLTLRERLGLAAGEFFIYGPVRDQLGLRKARWCYTGGAPLGPDTYRFFRSFGINLKQVYGATEASALIDRKSVV